MHPVRGSFWVYLLYDVAEEIDLAAVRTILRTDPPRREPSFRRQAPEYVRFENPAVVERVDVPALESGDRPRGTAKYYDYGVISLELELPFEASFDELAAMSSRWVGSPELERSSGDLVRRLFDRIRNAAKNAYTTWLSEDYYVVQISDARNDSEAALTAAEMLARHGPAIAKIVRGDSIELSPAEQREVLASSVSYYPTDLLVVAWSAAFVYDTGDGAVPTLQILAYANSQLLEYRHYDEYLTRILAGVYKKLEKRPGFFSRWKMAREAETLNTVRLDITELTERSDNAIKFLSDMFHARVYKLASDKVGVTDYRRLVDEKLRTARELYEFMVNHFHNARAFALEAMVVAILVIELVFLFTGKAH